MPNPTFRTQTTRWKAVKEKDASADGIFVYAVRTTKIYCRPVCRARLPREANVAFYDTAAEAERAGYRPCKRCKPDLAVQVPENHAVRRVRAMVEKEFPLNGGLGLAEMARQAGLSKWHFHRVFKEVTSMTPTEYVLRQKSGDSSPNPNSSLDELSSGPQSCGMTDEMTVTKGLGCSAVEAGPPESLIGPVPEHGAWDSAFGATGRGALDEPMPYSVELNLDDPLPDHYIDFFEELSRMPAEYEPAVPDTWNGVLLPDWLES